MAGGGGSSFSISLNGIHGFAECGIWRKVEGNGGGWKLADVADENGHGRRS